MSKEKKEALGTKGVCFRGDFLNTPTQKKELKMEVLSYQRPLPLKKYVQEKERKILPGSRGKTKRKNADAREALPWWEHISSNDWKTQRKDRMKGKTIREGRRKGFPRTRALLFPLQKDKSSSNRQAKERNEQKGKKDLSMFSDKEKGKTLFKRAERAEIRKGQFHLQIPKKIKKGEEKAKRKDPRAKPLLQKGKVHREISPPKGPRATPKEQGVEKEVRPQHKTREKT